MTRNSFQKNLLFENDLLSSDVELNVERTYVKRIVNGKKEREEEKKGINTRLITGKNKTTNE